MVQFRIVLLTCIGLTIPALALTDANVTIIVTAGDDQGPRVGGAEICLVNDADQVVAGPETTPQAGGNAGRARFINVPSGSYDTIASAASFVGQRIGPIDVADVNLVRNIVLPTGDPADGVTCSNPIPPVIEPPVVPPMNPPGLGPGAGPIVLPTPVDGLLNINELVISNLTINDGADEVNSQQVQLGWQITYLDVPFEYRTSRSDDLEGAVWTLLSDAAVVSEGANIFNQIQAGAGLSLDPVTGPQSVFLQVRHQQNHSIVSNILQADIFFQALAMHTIDAGDAYDFARLNGWNFDFEGDRFLINHCMIRSFETAGLGVNALNMETRRALLAFLYRGVTGCRFSLFTGRELNTGWTFVSTTVIPGASATSNVNCAGDANTRVVSLPTAGDTAIGMEITIASDDMCFADIPTIVLSGPAEQPWTGAFRQ